MGWAGLGWAGTSWTGMGRAVAAIWVSTQSPPAAYGSAPGAEGEARSATGPRGGTR